MAVRKHLALALLLTLGLSACASSEPPQAETPPTRQTQPEAPEPTLEEQQQAAAEEYTEKLTLSSRLRSCSLHAVRTRTPPLRPPNTVPADTSCSAAISTAKRRTR